MIFIWPYGNSLPVVFRSAGNAKFPLIVSMTSMIVCRIVFSYIFAIYFHMGMLGTWAAMYVDWSAKAIVYIIHDRKGKTFGKESKEKCIK